MRHYCVICHLVEVERPGMICRDCSGRTNFSYVPDTSYIVEFFKEVAAQIREESEKENNWLDEFWERIEGGSGPIRW